MARTQPVTVRLRTSGTFSLVAAARFASEFPGTRADATAATLTYAWAVDDDWRTVRVVLHSHHNAVIGTFCSTIADDLCRRAAHDLERILSLDVDGTGFDALGHRDPVVGALQSRFPGLRPFLFYTPYEAAAWAIIGHRIRMTQAATIKQRLATELGRDGAFPSPAVLAGIRGPQAGLTESKLQQLRAAAAAALEGRLSRDRLRQLPAEAVSADLQTLPGIGPFSAELIRIRGAGDPDVFPEHEPRALRALRAAYALSDEDDVTAIVDGWRPYRTWVTLLLRAWMEAETGEVARGRREDVPLPSLR